MCFRVTPDRLSQSFAERIEANTVSSNIKSKRNQGNKKISCFCAVYVDIMTITTLNFNLGAAGAYWDIKVSQIECNSKML
jgi:hypothetical protein